MRRNNESGFSLIELLVVVAIMLVIAAIAIPAAIAATQAGREASAASTVKQVVTAENGYTTLYPTIGYSALGADLAMSGGSSACPTQPSADGHGACLLPDNLATNLDAGTAVSGYQFSYTSAATGTVNTSFAVVAVPNPITAGRKAYCADSSGAVVWSWIIGGTSTFAPVSRCPKPDGTATFAL